MPSECSHPKPFDKNAFFALKIKSEPYTVPGTDLHMELRGLTVEQADLWDSDAPQCLVELAKVAAFDPVTRKRIFDDGDDGKWPGLPAEILEPIGKRILRLSGMLRSQQQGTAKNSPPTPSSSSA